MQSAQANAALFTEVLQDHTMALANLATATQANKTSVALLTKIIAELTTQVTSLTAKKLTTQSENARFKKSIHRMANTGASAKLTPTCEQTIYAKSRQKFDPNRYCSSHGFKVEETHTSVTCLYPLDEHKKFATRLDTNGRKQWNKYCINGGPID